MCMNTYPGYSCIRKEEVLVIVHNHNFYMTADQHYILLNLKAQFFRNSIKLNVLYQYSVHYQRKQRVLGWYKIYKMNTIKNASSEQYTHCLCRMYRRVLLVGLLLPV